MISRFNHGIGTGLAGAVVGLFGAGAKYILPTRLVGIQQPDAANIVAALSLGKFILGLLDYDRDNGSALRTAIGVNNILTWTHLFLIPLRHVLAFMSEGTPEQKKKMLVEFENDVAYMFLLNMVVSLGENITASMLGHGALALMGYSTFSLQQALVDATVATAPSIIPTRLV